MADLNAWFGSNHVLKDVSIDKARALIAEFPASPAQRALASLTELVTDRDH